jgi:serine/threonine protein kinase
MDSIIIIDTTWKINLQDLVSIEVITQHNNVTLYRSMWRKFQQVCVKRIKVTPKNHKYVQREFDIVKICAHPCIYQFYGACVDTTGLDEYVYLVFEYMEQGNLLDYLKKNTVSISEKTNIIQTIAVGMHYLYSRKPVSIIHRDFKPENILVNKYGDVKIADFGISKQTLNGIENENSLRKEFIDPLMSSSIGTLRWTAPEIICPDENATTYTHLCDVYSLGLLIYFVFTEKLPYWENYKNNCAQITYAKYNNIRPFLDDLQNTPIIYELVKACTEKDPTLRPQNPEDIIYKIKSNKWSCLTH